MHVITRNKQPATSMQSWERGARPGDNQKVVAILSWIWSKLCRGAADRG